MRRTLHITSGLLVAAIIGVMVPAAVIAQEQFANRQTLGWTTVALIITLAVFILSSDAVTDWRRAVRGRVYAERESERELRSAILAVRGELESYRDRLKTIRDVGTFDYKDRDRPFRLLQWQRRRDLIGRHKDAEDAYSANEEVWRHLRRINDAIRERVPPRHYVPGSGAETWTDERQLRGEDDVGGALSAIDRAVKELNKLKERL